MNRSFSVVYWYATIPVGLTKINSWQFKEWEIPIYPSMTLKSRGCLNRKAELFSTMIQMITPITSPTHQRSEFLESQIQLYSV